MRRRTKRLAALTVAAAGVAVFVGSALAGPEAGAVEWFKPVTVDGGPGYVDLLAVPYEPAPGRGDSIHATCAADGGGVEIGLHPFDGVARNIQVWDYIPPLSPPIPIMLANETSADWSGVFDFGWLAIQYAGLRYNLVSPDEQRALCVSTVGSSVPTVDTTVPTTTPPPSSSSTTSPSSSTVPAPDTTSPPTVVSGPAPPPSFETQVLTSSIGPVVEPPRGELPNTGADTWKPAALGVGLVATGLSIVRRPGRKLTEVEV